MITTGAWKMSPLLLLLITTSIRCDVLVEQRRLPTLESEYMGPVGSEDSPYKLERMAWDSALLANINEVGCEKVLSICRSVLSPTYPHQKKFNPWQGKRSSGGNVRRNDQNSPDHSFQPWSGKRSL